MKDRKNKQILPRGNFEKVLLHICCAPDATYPVLLLKGLHFNVTGFFYNPNIHPKEEYEKRLEEVRKLSEYQNFPLIVGEYNDEVLRSWFHLVRGLEKEHEGGNRCYLCYKERLERTAKLAHDLGFDYFTTTITISPHKRSDWVFEIAHELENIYGVKFLEIDFKKKNGFKASVILSKYYGLYRQNYCGCIFSKVESDYIRRIRTKE
ncbi:MAG: epoxyqueuosine reductase QueH [Caldisericum sp.]